MMNAEWWSFGVCVCVYVQVAYASTFSEISLYIHYPFNKKCRAPIWSWKLRHTGVWGIKLAVKASIKPADNFHRLSLREVAMGWNLWGFFPSKSKGEAVKPTIVQAEYFLGMKVNHWYGFKDSSIRFLASKDEIESLQKIHRNSYQSQTLPTLIAQPKTLQMVIWFKCLHQKKLAVPTLHLPRIPTFFLARPAGPETSRFFWDR